MARTKKKKKWKPLFYSILFLALALVAAIYVFGEKEAKKLPDKEKQVTSPSIDQTSNQDTLINETFSLAKEGKIIDFPFVSGKTKIQDVRNAWGQPKGTTKTENSIYEEYTNGNVVGFKGEIVNDIRSYAAKLQNIHLNEIKKDQ
ncbi:MAG TPA: DUF4309 domain-containing protein, partial [Bacillales bacterium]|nr:DUF4309 domain-containing protein [Bacillales bacterium]